MAVRKYCCILLADSSSSFRVSRSTPSCRRFLSGLHEYDPSQTSPSAASSRILRAALSRSLAEGWMAMSSLRQLYESSNSSQRVPQPTRRRFRGQPDHVVFGLSQQRTFRFSLTPHCFFLGFCSENGVCASGLCLNTRLSLAT